MRIIHITNHFLPSSGGVEWSVFRTAEAQSHAGHDVIVITETAAGEWRDSEVSFAVQRFSVPVLRPITRLLYWRRMWGYRELLRSADVLHFHDYTVFVHWFLPLRPLIRGPRYAVTFHGFEHWPVRTRHQFFRCLTARLCQVRFAVGDYVRQLYRHPVDAVYLGAPVRELPVLQPAEEMNFCYAGRLEEDTQILPLATMLSKLAKETGKRVRLDAAGEGTQREALQQLSHENFDMRLHGQVRNVLPLFNEARFIIATGFLGILEAFQTDIPVIIPAFNELKQKYVASLPAADELALVLRNEIEGEEQMMALLTDAHADALRSRAERAREFVSEQTWDDISALLEKWYNVPAASPRKAD